MSPALRLDTKQTKEAEQFRTAAVDYSDTRRTTCRNTVVAQNSGRILNMKVANRIQKLTVGILWRADDAVDSVFYRPAIVKALRYLPRYWQCDFARLSGYLDRQWQTGFWDVDGEDGVIHHVAVGPPCEACGRRASTLLIGRMKDWDPTFPNVGDMWDEREVELCDWCGKEFCQEAVRSEDELQSELERVRKRTVSWRWS